MGRMAIISVDGHAKASLAGYRDYIEQRYLDVYDDWVTSVQEAGGDPGNIQPQLGPDSQWDSDRRLADLETQGVVAEVLFPNGMPFQQRRFEDVGYADDPELTRQARAAYNRWLVDFCTQAPDRRAGQLVVSFDDVDQAVKDIHWAKEHGLRGIMMPALNPGGTFFFDPVLDPIWAACVDVGLPISQHGGAGTPRYQPPGFAAIMTLAFEQGFYSGRSMWQMILGGVFERFPDLRVVYVETEIHWIGTALHNIDRRLQQSDDWMDFAKLMNRERPFNRLARDYWETNCYAGVSPFHPNQIAIDRLGTGYEPEPGEFRISSARAMFGVDYPHFESIFPGTKDQVANLVQEPSITDDDLRKLLFDNAVEVYGFDVDALQPHVDRAGFERDEVLAATPR